MTGRRGGLGRGLGALLPADPTAHPTAHPTADGASPLPVAGAVLRDVAVAAVRPNPRQPRTSFDEDALEELAASIREVGVLQPIVVREVGSDSYELVMGERRWRAAQHAGLVQIPAIVRDTTDDALLRDALLENLHRQQLNPLEEAAAYQQLLEDFGATHEELAARLGRSRPHISNTLRLLALPPTVQRRLAAGVLSAGHARALLAMPDPSEQEVLAARIVAEGLSVRAVEEAVALGVRSRPPRALRQGTAQPPVAAEAAERLSAWLDTRVRVEVGRAKGRITVEFAGVDDLERILGELHPHRASAGER
ncbi:MAG: ParB/RepB/Spo0J family partition protein [Mycobacteriales bacterium]